MINLCHTLHLPRSWRRLHLHPKTTTNSRLAVLLLLALVDRHCYIDKMNPELTTAIKTVGQLLLHHPTTGHYARSNSGTKIGPFHSDANCFCFLGACFAVQNKLHQSGLQLKCAGILQWTMLDEFHPSRKWDRASAKTRKQWAQKLADFTGDTAQ